MTYADVINSQSPAFYSNGSASFDTLPGGIAGSKIDTGFNVAPYVNNAYGTVYGPTNVSAYSLSFYTKIGGVIGTQSYTLARFTQSGAQKFRVVAVGKNGPFDLAIIDYNGTQVNLVTNADPNAWYHIAVRRTTSTSSTYDAFVNGVKVISAATMGNWVATTWNINVGMYGTGYDYNKSFDEIAAWSRVLTDQEILDQYNAGNAPTTTSATVSATPASISLSPVNPLVYSEGKTRTGGSGYPALIKSIADYYVGGNFNTTRPYIVFPGNSLTPINTSSYTVASTGTITTDVAGRFGGAYGFASNTALMIQSTTGTGFVGHMSFWFKHTGNGAVDRIALLRTGTGTVASTTNSTMSMAISSTGYITINGNPTQYAANDRAWHHVAFGGGSIYIDGNLINSVSYSSTNAVNSFIVGNASGTTAALFDEVTWISAFGTKADGTGYSNATVSTAEYGYTETYTTLPVATLSFYGTTANGVTNKTPVVQRALPAVIGLNGTYNNTPRVNDREVGASATISFAGIAGNVTTSRRYVQTAAPGTASLRAGTVKAYSPDYHAHIDAMDIFLQGMTVKAFQPNGQKVNASPAIAALYAVPANVTLRTHRTVKLDAATIAIRGTTAKVKIAGVYVEGLNDNNRWYQAIRSIYPSTLPAPYWDDAPGKINYSAWFKFEGDTPPSEPSGAAGPNLGTGPGPTTGPVAAYPPFEMHADAGHTRSGIHLHDGGWFQTHNAYPHTIWGAQLPLAGGLRTHYTVEFAFKADAPGGLYTGARINAAGRLEIAQMDYTNVLGGPYWYELRTDYANLLDGNFHHVILISPRNDYFVPAGANAERRYIIIDGKIASAVHAPENVPSTWGNSAYKGTDGIPGLNPSITFDDIIVSMFRILSLNEAQRLYYEYSDAVIMKAPTFQINGYGTSQQRPKGNVKKMLVFYGSPMYTLTPQGALNNIRRAGMHINEYSGFTLPDLADSMDGVPNSAHNTFRWNDYLCFPVSYGGGLKSAEGILDVNRATYVDDFTGYTRPIDLENDFKIDPLDFDAMTFIRWPQMDDRFITFPSTGGAALRDRTSSANFRYAVESGVEANDILAARERNINRFAKQVIGLVHKGLDLLVQDPETAQGLGLIKDYTQMYTYTEQTEEYGVLNIAARRTDNKYGQSWTGSFGSPGYGDGGHNVWKRRIVAKIEGFSDVTSWYTTDKVGILDGNPFAKHAQISRFKYTKFDSLNVGDEIQVEGGNLAYIPGRRDFANYMAEPSGVIGIPLSLGQDKYALKDGSFVTNPYRNWVQSFFIPEDTVLNGKLTKGRIFVDISEKFSQTQGLLANDKNYDDGRPIAVGNGWDYDSTRENQVVAYYALEKFRNGTYFGSESLPYIVFGDGVPTTVYPSIDMFSRGALWLNAKPDSQPGDTKVKLTPATMTAKAQPSIISAARNSKVSVQVSYARLEMKLAQNFKASDQRQTAFPARMTLMAVDRKAIVKLPVATMVITAGNGLALADITPDFTLYYEVFAPTLYLEEL